MALREVRQSTTVSVAVGPVWNTSGVAQSALSFVSSSIWLFKGIAARTNLHFAGSATQLGGGVYGVTLQPADVGGALGSVVKILLESSALQAWEQVQIVEPEFYDAKYATGSLSAQVKGIDANAINTASIAANALASAAVAPALIDKFFVEVVDGSVTFRALLAYALAVLSGETTNSGSQFKAPDGATTRVALGFDNSRNRTSSTLTPP